MFCQTITDMSEQAPSALHHPVPDCLWCWCQQGGPWCKARFQVLWLHSTQHFPQKETSQSYIQNYHEEKPDKHQVNP